MYLTFIIISNTPSIIFYNSTMTEFVRIVRSTLLLKGFLFVATKSIRPNHQSRQFQTDAFKTD